MSDELNKTVNPKKARILVVIISLILTAAVVACGIFILPDLLKKGENEEASQNTKTAYVLESMVLTEYYYFEDFNHEEKIDCKLIDDGNAYHLEMWPRSNDVYRKEFEFVYKYDNFGNPVSFERYDEGEKTLSSSCEYDENGNCICLSIDEENRYNCINEYDENKNCISITVKHNNEDYLLKTFEYDENNNMKKETVFSNGELSESYIYEYNSEGKLVKAVNYNKDGVEKKTYILEYDSNGNYTKITSYNGSELSSIIEFSYTSKSLSHDEATKIKRTETVVLRDYMSVLF